MSKQESIINLSSIFNRGASSDAQASKFFNNKKHDDLLDILIAYLSHSTKLIGNPKIYKTQALNDRGVDLIVEFPDTTKIGIQIKSPFDVTEKEFALKVKAQMAESQAHGLDKWFLLICSPLNDGKNDYTAKISHLLNELSSYKSSYHSVFTPQQSCNLLTLGVMPLQDFNSIKKQFIFEPVDWASLLKEIKKESKGGDYLDKVEKQNEIKSVTADLYLKHIQFGEEERESTLADLNDLQETLKELTKPTRKLLYAALLRSKDQPSFPKIFGVSCQELENYLHISTDTLKREVAILSGLKIAAFTDENDTGVWYVSIFKKISGENILKEVKEFCSKTGKPLEDIVVNLDFSNFDE